MIRPATIHDAKFISLLWRELVEYHLRLDARLPRAAAEGEQRYARRIADHIHDDNSLVLVEERDGQIVGYILVVVIDIAPETFESEYGGFIADIYVDPAYRRFGIGKSLVTQSLQWFSEMGVSHYEWYVAANNLTGRAFWTALGGSDVMIRMRANL